MEPASPLCGHFVRELRRRKGLSQTELAERIGMPQATISRIEQDTGSPSLHTLNRLLEGMGETLQLTAVPLEETPPGGGNVSIRDLRAGFDATSPDQRIERAATLSNVGSELAASRRR